jgi:hypothetical protein
VTSSSGDIVVGVATGVGVYLDLSSVTGSVTSKLDEAEGGDDVPLEVTCRTVSGDIRIIRAPVTEPEQRRSVPPPPAASTSETPPPAG